MCAAASPPSVCVAVITLRLYLPYGRTIRHSAEGVGVVYRERLLFQSAPFTPSPGYTCTVKHSAQRTGSLGWSWGAGTWPCPYILRDGHWQRLDPALVSHSLFLAERAPSITAHRALRLSWECSRVALPLSSGVGVGSAFSQPSGSFPLIKFVNCSCSCAPPSMNSIHTHTLGSTTQACQANLGFTGIGSFLLMSSIRYYLINRAYTRATPGRHNTRTR